MGAVDKPLQRPPQVTSACLFIGLSCGLLLYTLVGLLTSWSSLSVQEGLAKIFDDAGATLTDGRVEAIRIALQVLVVLLVAGLVCAVYALRRHAPSRIVVTVVAGFTALVFLVISFPIGLIPAGFATYAIVQLWSPPARRWFAGQPEPEAPAPVRSADPFADRGPTPPAPTGYAPPTAPSGPAPIEHVPPPQGAAAPTQPTGSQVPRDVRVIDLIVTIGGAVTAIGAIGYLAIYLLAHDALVEAQLDSPYSFSDISEAELTSAMRYLAVLSAVALTSSIAALGAVRLLVRRNRAAHVVLTVIAAVTAGVGVLVIVGIPWAAVAVWVLVLLRRRATVGWVSSASR